MKTRILGGTKRYKRDIVWILDWSDFYLAMCDGV